MTSPTPISLTRPQLMARLAGERGHLFWSFVGLTEPVMTETILHDNWKVKDLLPHIGRWDETFADWVGLFQNGRLDEIAARDDETGNRVWHEQTQHYTLEQGVAVLLKARGGLWAALERLTDEEFDQPLTLMTGRVTMVRRWVAAAYRHDAEHADEVLTWRKANNIPRGVGPLALVRATVRATRKEFLAVAANIPTAEHSTRPVCGVWTL